MKVHNKKARKYKKIILLAVLIVLLAVSLLFFILRPNESEPGAKQSTSSPTQVEHDISVKTPTNVEPVKNTSADVSSINSSLTYVNQENSILSIGTSIDYLTNIGSCTLTLNKDGKTIRKTTNIQALVSSSTCNGFQIPIIELSKGTWSIRIDIESSAKQSHVIGNVTIN